MELLRLMILTLLVSLPVVSNGRESEDDRRQKQTELDYVCEHARQVALGPRKLEIYKECIKKKKKEAYCLLQGDNYNGDRRNGSPLFYDLPECETAFKYRSQHRKAD
jgi:hypothetical protein